MNEFEPNNVKNENEEKEQIPANNYDKTTENGFSQESEIKSENISQQKTEDITWNADGTYHSSVKTENTVSQNNKNGYNAERVKTEQQKTSSYPYGANYYNSYNQNTQQNQNPYNNQNNYPYGNHQQNQYNVHYQNGDYNTQNNPYGTQNNGNFQRNTNYAYNNNTSNNKNKKSKGIKIFAATAGVLFIILIGSLIGILVSGDNKSTVNPDNPSGDISENVQEYETSVSPITGENQNSEGELTPKTIFNKVLPSSVGILVYNKSKALVSEGSGVLFHESDDKKYTYIVTCAHVISDSSGYISVQLHDGEKHEAQVVGYDARTDIGVLRVNASGLTLADIGDSSKTAVGDPIYAIGNPGGVEFANSFTDGIVSALDRPVSSSSTGYTTDCIQHTAAINPGNSGGALVNAFGQVIGINSMKIVDDEYEGMGFAVPSSVFIKIVNEIMANGYVTNRPKLGITYVPASEYSTYGMFVAIKELPSGSIVIYSIASDSSLAGTQAQEGDMIIAVNGTPLDDASYLSELIEKSNVGDKLTLSLIRIHDDYSFEELEVTVTLVEDRGDTLPSQQEEDPTQGGYSGGNTPDDYNEYFDRYFEEYFKDFFGGR